MAILTQIMDPEELARLSPQNLELLGHAIHAELLTNKDVLKALAPRIEKLKTRLVAASKKTPSSGG